MSLVSELLYLLFPNRCVLCGNKSTSLLCEECLSSLNLNFNRCSRCSSPIPSKESLCSFCLKEKRYFTKGFSLFNYKENKVAKIIELIKFYGKFGLVDFLNCFRNEIKNIDFWSDIDYLIPVPMHPSSLRKRGFNQSVLISKKIGKIIDKPVCFDCVAKTKLTKSQVGLSMEERKTNLKNAFKVLNLNKNIKNVAIIDDVFTTGSTINEIARLLSKYGIQSYFFTLASTPAIA